MILRKFFRWNRGSRIRVWCRCTSISTISLVSENNAKWSRTTWSYHQNVCVTLQKGWGQRQYKKMENWVFQKWKVDFCKTSPVGERFGFHMTRFQVHRRHCSVLWTCALTFRIPRVDLVWLFMMLLRMMNFILLHHSSWPDLVSSPRNVRSCGCLKMTYGTRPRGHHPHSYSFLTSIPSFLHSTTPRRSVCSLNHR